METEAKPLKVAAAAAAAGVNVQTLHYYERRGLLRPARSSTGGYRYYGPSDVQLVRAVKRAQALGFSLQEIEELLTIRNSDRSRVAELARAKCGELDAKIRDLTAIRSALGELMETCVCGGDLSRCDVLDGLQTGEAD